MAFLTFHTPLAKRESVDYSQVANTATEAAAEAAAIAAAEPVAAGTLPPVDTSASANTGCDAKNDGGGRGDGVHRDNGDSSRASSPGAQGIRRSKAETDKRTSRAAASTTPDENDTELRADVLEKTAAVVTPRNHLRTEEGQRRQHHQRTDYPGGTKHYGDRDHERESNGADEASVDTPGRFAATAALTPESVVPVPFSPGSTGARSTTSSGGFLEARSPAARDAESERVSSVAELLRPGTGGAAGALRLEPLELFSDEDEA